MVVSSGIYLYGIKVTTRKLLQWLREGIVEYTGDYDDWKKIQLPESKNDDCENCKCGCGQMFRSSRGDRKSVCVCQCPCGRPWCECKCECVCECKCSDEEVEQEYKDILYEIDTGELSLTGEYKNICFTKTPHECRWTDIEGDMLLLGDWKEISFGEGKLDSKLGYTDDVDRFIKEHMPDEEPVYLFFPNDCNCCS